MATKSIGTLKASLILDNKGFLFGFQQAGKAVQKQTASIGALGKTALASVASVSALWESFSRVDRTAKLADRLGLTNEAMQKLRLAADLSGVDVNILAKAMLHMGRTIGSGGKPLDKRLFEVADAIAKIEDPAKRAERAIKVFGKGGEELLTALMSGGKGIRESAAAIDRFGLAISRADASKIEQANDAITVLTTVLKGFVDKLSVSLAPQITKSIDSILNSIEHLQSAIDRLGGSWKTLDSIFGSSPGIGRAIEKVERLAGVANALSLLPAIAKANMSGDAAKTAELSKQFEDSLRGVFGKKSATAAGESGGSRTADLFSAASKAGKPVKPAALEFNTVEAVRAINNAGGDATGGVVTELKNILRTINIFGDDARRASAAKDGFLIKEGKL